MAHGAGGKASRALVEGLVVPLLANPALEQLSDAALLTVGGVRLALTTDAFVVRPIRFPGGSIGELAVNGTVNDLAVSGARPVALSAAVVLEEGLAAEVLEAEITAMAAAARAADVPVVTGDTKVVERGKCDSMYIVTTGVGVIDGDVALAPQLVRPGDKVLRLRHDRRPRRRDPAGQGRSRHRGRRTQRHRAVVVVGLGAARGVWRGLALHAGRHPRRRRDRAERDRARRRGGHRLSRSRGCRCVPRWSAPVRSSASTRSMSPTRASSSPSSRRSTPTLRSPPCARCRPARMRRSSGRFARSRPGRVLGRTTFGGHRLIDMLVGDPLPRIC